jgi:hypothetical protein
MLRRSVILTICDMALEEADDVTARRKRAQPEDRSGAAISRRCGNPMNERGA